MSQKTDVSDLKDYSTTVSNKMATFAEVDEIAEALFKRLKENASSQVDNVANHFRLLTESHGYRDRSQDPQAFWDSFVNDESFFVKENMPKRWGSDSSYGHGIESMMKIMKEERVKEILERAWTANGYKTALNTCDARRKKYLTKYKKDRRDEEAKEVECEEEGEADEDDVHETESVVSANSEQQTQQVRRQKKKQVQVVTPSTSIDTTENVAMKYELQRMRDQKQHLKKMLERCMKETNPDVIRFGLESLMIEIERD
jgi:hypothetical protein